MAWGSGLAKGLWVTIRAAARGTVAIDYPEERLELPERARWAVVPLFDEDGMPKCTACMDCVRECPDDALDLQVDAGEDGRKHIVRFTYEVGACMFCGLCVERCSFSALAMGTDYELATRRRHELSRILIEDVAAAGEQGGGGDG